MTRITKNPEERKNEIIKTAQKLFIEKGFIKTKVNSIVKSIGVSQGVFYYYFSSKDEIIDEIVDRYIKQIINNTADIIESSQMNPIEKLNTMSDIQLKINMLENNNIHAIKGVDIHERILKRLILDYVPLMQKAFSEEKDKQTLFLLEIFVAAGNVLFDPGIFQWEKEEKNERIVFLIEFMEKSLNVPNGTFSFYKGLMGFVK
ncbi:MAG: TetR/AcrR family transcriptional regulator [Desulfobacteraceae bacterium]|nr:TetR/AcrR family transcriptional regulator [Desulfobacteraceae bacterium]